MLAIQTVNGGPLSPSSSGPHTSDTVEFVLVDPYDFEAVHEAVDSLLIQGKGFNVYL